MCHWQKYGKCRFLAGKKVNDIATVSDKSFILLLIENIWDDMMEVDIDKY